MSVTVDMPRPMNFAACPTGSYFYYPRDNYHAIKLSQPNQNQAPYALRLVENGVALAAPTKGELVFVYENVSLIPSMTTIVRAVETEMDPPIGMLVASPGGNVEIVISYRNGLHLVDTRYWNKRNFSGVIDAVYIKRWSLVWKKDGAQEILWEYNREDW